MIRTTPKMASVLTSLLATANTEAVSMIAIEMAIRVRVCFLTVYTSFMVCINSPEREIRERVKTHQSRI
jgi:hypothetical protein